MITSEKKCNHCHLPNKEYTTDKRNSDGLQGTCNDCRNSKRRLLYSNDPIPHRIRQRNYNDYALEKAKRHIREISDTYVIAELKRGTELTTADIRKFPEMIEAKRQILINKRVLKNEKRKRLKG